MKLRFVLAPVAIVCALFWQAGDAGHVWAQAKSARMRGHAPSASPAPQRPLPADSIVDEVGIVVHFSYENTGYKYLTQASPAPNGSNVVAALKSLGVRHVRSGVADTEARGYGSTSASFGAQGRCGAYQTAAANGEDFDLVTDINDDLPHVNASESDLGVAVKCLGRYASHLLAIEGPNERGSGRDCNGTEPPPAAHMAPYIGTFTTSPTSECIPEILGQQRIMALARRDRVIPATTQLWSAAFANTGCEDEYEIAHYRDTYGLRLTDYVDAVSSHAYLAYNEPEYTDGPGPYRGVPCGATSHLDGGSSGLTYNFIDNAAYGSLKYYAESVRYSGLLPSGNAAAKPAVMTETGYEAECCGNSDTDVDVRTVTKYTIRELMMTQAAGFRKQFIYELISDSESLGLTDRFLNPKPVYYALENFITLLQDPGYASMTTRPFALGLRAPGDVLYVIYQKHDGSNWLVIWQDDKSYDHATMTPIRVEPVSAAITLGALPTEMKYYLFDPATGSVATRVLDPAMSFTLPVSDMPAVLQIGRSVVARLAAPIPPLTATAILRAHRRPGSIGGR